MAYFPIRYGEASIPLRPPFVADVPLDLIDFEDLGRVDLGLRGALLEVGRELSGSTAVLFATLSSLALDRDVH